MPINCRSSTSGTWDTQSVPPESYCTSPYSPYPLSVPFISLCQNIFFFLYFSYFLSFFLFLTFLPFILYLLNYLTLMSRIVLKRKKPLQYKILQYLSKACTNIIIIIDYCIDNENIKEITLPILASGLVTCGGGMTQSTVMSTPS